MSTLAPSFTPLRVVSPRASHAARCPFTNTMSLRSPISSRSTSSNCARGAFVTPQAAATAETPTPPTPWVMPALWNRNDVRASVLLAVTAAAATSAGSLGARSIALIHLLSFATWFGVTAWVTFVAGIVQFKNMPRQGFGKLQSKLFPIYFSLLSVAIVLCIGCSTAMGGVLATKASMVNLAGGLVCTLLNVFALEPLTTSNMFARYEMENRGSDKTDPEAYGKLKKAFGPLHGVSSLVNLLAFIAAILHANRLVSLLV